MKCILQLIGLNKLKGQYAYIHTSTFSSQHFFFLRVQLYIVCMYIVFFYFKFEFKMPLRTKSFNLVFPVILNSSKAYVKGQNISKGILERFLIQFSMQNVLFVFCFN